MDRGGRLPPLFIYKEVNMSYSVDFYTLTKKSNSTLYPSSGATSYNCNIKNGSGILTPKVELNLGLTTDPSGFNYCHITNFDRWYYVTEWYFDYTRTGIPV